MTRLHMALLASAVITAIVGAVMVERAFTAAIAAQFTEMNR